MDATYGYSAAELLSLEPPPPPDDFAEFWAARSAAARALDPDARMRPSRFELPETKVYDVEFSSTGGVRLGGWLALPADGPIERGLVMGHGYGGRNAPEPPLALAHAAVLFPCARGLGDRSRIDGIPDTAEEHVLHGIADRDTYVHGGCAEDVWSAVSALIQLVPQTAARIDYAGGSFGGGIGALAVPWDERISAACLWLPSFGHHPLRVTLPCTGSGEAVRRHVAARPTAMQVLQYFDAATAAAHIRVPTHVALALDDPAVPPPGQFAVFNALGGPRQRFVRSRGHREYPGRAAEVAAMREAQSAFLERV